MLQGAATPEADVDVSTLKHVRNDIGVMNERWVRRLRGVSPTELLDEVPRDDRRAAQGLDGHVRRRLERDHRDAGRSGHLWTVHARAGLRLLDAPARHPRCTRSTRRRHRPGGSVVPAGARRDGGQHGIRRRQARRRARRVAGGHRTDGTAAADHQRATCRAAAGWSRTSAGRSRRRRSPSTACCSPGWRADGPRPPGIRRAVSYGGDEAVGRRVVEHLNYVI